MAINADQAVGTDCVVTFQPAGLRVKVPAGTTLLEAGRRAGLLLSAACGGVGICGRCRVSVVKGEMLPASAEEAEFLVSGSYSQGTRLACEARLASSVVVDVTAGSFTTGQRLQIESDTTVPAPDPIIRSHQLHLHPATLEDSRSNSRRVTDALFGKNGTAEWTMRPAVASQLASLQQSGRLSLTAFTRGAEIVGFAAESAGVVGLAVDLGCTKIAAYLVDLSTGAQLAAAGTPNPQITYGEDLISRLVYASRSPEQAKTLAGLVRKSMSELAEELCDSANLSSEQIADVCVVGNTAMVHLFLELPVQQLLCAPFISAIDCDVDIPADELGWRFAPAANVHVLPSIGGFVGADHVAMILARDIDRTDKVTVGLDIGTNTEIVVRDPRSGKFLTTSVPSGPVFEGAHIVHGMRAASGAIEAVYSVNGEICFRTIDSVRPIGLCGSGTVDLVSELLHLGYINERGHLARDGKRVRRGDCGSEFVLVPGAETEHGHDIVLSQHDISQVQLAKAAIYAGIETLLKLAELPADSVEQVIVAGAFGSYLDLRSAINIGMLPRFANAEYMQVGNAAGAGAKIALVSAAERERARTIARNATRIELKKYGSFDSAMARATRFRSS